MLNRAADAAKQAGVPCDTIHVKDAYPYQAIIATAGDRGCDLIVMASHGRSGLSAIVLGSVTNKVLTHQNPGVGVSLNAPAARLAALSYRPCRHVSYFGPNRTHLGPA